VKQLATLVAVMILAPTAICSYAGSASQGPAPATTLSSVDLTADYAATGREVMQHIQASFYLPEHDLYAHSLTKRHPEFMWGNGVMFSALLGAARHDPKTYSPLVGSFFKSMDRYWDTEAKIAGYEPAPTRGGGNDKYYDDNAWMVLSFLEAYEMTQDRRYLQRAEQTLSFVLSGWDEQAGGGIWWHEGHKGESKNTCSNAPSAVACLRLAKHQSPDKAKTLVAKAQKIVDWTVKTFESEDGLYADGMNLKTGKVNRDQLTYNTALMIRAFLGLYRATGDETFLHRANRAARASDWFLDKKTRAYRDSVKWSHLLVEADLEMYRATGEDYLLRRAADNADHQYATWKQKPPSSLIDNASIARTLWLMADVQSEAGRRFWERVDRP
jgi:hypothetical protein